MARVLGLFPVALNWTAFGRSHNLEQGRFPPLSVTPSEGHQLRAILDQLFKQLGDIPEDRSRQFITGHK